MFKKFGSTLAVALLTLVCSSPFAAQLVNVNTADAIALAENLNGIGSAKAQAIVEYRKLHGDFQSVDDLIKVKGIGSKLIEKNSEFISFGKGGTATGVAAASSTAQPPLKDTVSTPVLPASN